MTLRVRLQEGRFQTKTLVLEGRLDHESVNAVDTEIDAVLATDVKILVFDLGKLEYITSAGLRSIFRAQKALKDRGGKSVLFNPQPPVQKVLEIVRVPELGSVFRSLEELDTYLDAIQKNMSRGQ